MSTAVAATEGMPGQGASDERRAWSDSRRPLSLATVDFRALDASLGDCAYRREADQ